MSDWFEENKYKITPEELQQVEHWETWRSNMTIIGCAVTLVTNISIFRNKEFMNYCLGSTSGKINLLLIGMIPLWAGFYCSKPAKKERDKLIAELQAKYSPKVPEESENQITN